MIDCIWPAWSGMRPVCAGCGHTAPAFSRATTLSAIEVLTVRLSELSKAVASSHRPELTIPWTEATGRLSRTLASLNAHLQDLSALAGHQGHHERHRSLSTPTASHMGPCDGFAQLGWNIGAITDLCWQRPERVGDPSPAELTWLALHSILHELEDLELTINPPVVDDDHLACAG